MPGHCSDKREHRTEGDLRTPKVSCLINDGSATVMNGSPAFKKHERIDRKKRRDRAAIAAAVQATSRAAAVEQGIAPPNNVSKRKRVSIMDDGKKGLSLRGLVKRWQVAPQTALAKLVSAGLPIEGNEIYRWATIFTAEGVAAKIAAVATPETHPELFEDLLKPGVVAAILGFHDISTVRKLVLSGAIPREAYVSFGTRPIRHFRPLSIEEERQRRSPLRLV